MTRRIALLAGLAAGVWLLAALSIGYLDHALASIQITGSR